MNILQKSILASLIIIFLNLLHTDTFSQGPQWIVYNTSNSGIPTNLLGPIEIDSNNVKWIGSSSGLTRFDGNSWFTFNSSNSPITTTVVAIKKDKYNSLWFGVGTYGIYHLQNGIFTNYNTSNSGLPYNFIFAMAIESDTIKWFETAAGQLVRFDNINWTIYDTTNSGYYFDGSNALEVSGHTKWFGSGFHGLGTFNDTTWHWYNNTNSGLEDLRARSIFIESPEILWVGTYFKGLYKFNVPLNSWTNYNTANTPIPTNIINQIYKNSFDGNLFLGFGGDGVAKRSDTTWTLYGPPLPDGTGIGQFKKDKYNNIWITSTNGLFVYNPSGVVGINNQTDIVMDFKLYQNYPNPFNPSTKISYTLHSPNYITLKIFDLQGKEISVLMNGKQSEGSYAVDFNSKGLASGIYYYTLRAGKFSQTKKMILVK